MIHLSINLEAEHHALLILSSVCGKPQTRGVTDALAVDTHLDRMWHPLMQEQYPILLTPVASTPKRRYMSTWRVRPPLASPAAQALGGSRAAQRSPSHVQPLENRI